MTASLYGVMDLLDRANSLEPGRGRDLAHHGEPRERERRQRHDHVAHGDDVEAGRNEIGGDRE